MFVFYVEIIKNNILNLFLISRQQTIEKLINLFFLPKHDQSQNLKQETLAGERITKWDQTKLSNMEQPVRARQVVLLCGCIDGD